jgi:hypothetical protein
MKPAHTLNTPNPATLVSMPKTRRAAGVGLAGFGLEERIDVRCQVDRRGRARLRR